MKILQLNMHRSKVADALLPQIAIEQEADILIISEQHSRKTRGHWFEDNNKTAAIWIPNSMSIKPMEDGKGDGFVWIKIGDFIFMSCYLTPNEIIEEFQSKLDLIEDEIRRVGRQIIVAGDFNSRAIEWGMMQTNSRGKRIVEMTARTGLVVANVGNTPTFRRPGCEGTIPDITFVSEHSAGKILDWKVLDIYTASDHQYISYSVETNVKATARRTVPSTRRWNIKKLDRAGLISEIDRQLERMHIDGDARQIANKTIDVIIKGCNKSMPKIKSHNFKKPAVYWWSSEIEELRRNCIKQRRKFTRARKRHPAETEHTCYQEARKALRIAIQKNKKIQWEKLRDDINRDPWGLGYKLVMKKLGMRNPVGEMNGSTMDNIVNNLFPTHSIRPEDPTEENIVMLPLFTHDELKIAVRKLKDNKAPGPDGIPAEVLKVLAVTRPNLLLQMYNSCLTEGTFPEPWKEQHLVLISKGKGDPLSPSAYRPLCMLNTAGKLLERLIKPRLEEAVIMKGGLSHRQYGFRPCKSTMGALKHVVDAFTAAQERNHSCRPVILLATLDVKNAFNSLRWNDVLRALEHNFRVPGYLMKIIRSYLRNRVLIYHTTEGEKRKQVTSGAAQGSILGPDLWNISYDEILKIEMPEDTFLVGYADDIAAVIKARNTEDAQRRLTQVMIRTKEWLQSHGLELATHKTELLLMTRRRIPIQINMQIDDVLIPTKTEVNYLGIRLDTKLTFSAQINYAVTKSKLITAQLSRLMANIGGPLPKKRKLLMEACNSILLYGSELWADSLVYNSRAQKLLAMQRIAALRVTSAYRTVSASAVQVIAGMTPIDLLAEERSKIFKLRNNNFLDAPTTEDIKKDTIRKWQNRWNNETLGRWTAKLITDIRKWINRGHGDVNYYITQMLSGHGYFRSYLYKIGKCETPFCLYEQDDKKDDAEHTFFGCTRWTLLREEVMREIGYFNAENLLEKMTANEKNWNVVARYCERILRIKKADLDNPV